MLVREKYELNQQCEQLYTANQSLETKLEKMKQSDKQCTFIFIASFFVYQKFFWGFYST